MKTTEQQLQRDLVDDKYPGPTDWKVSTEESNKISRVEVICIGQGRDYVNMNTGKVELSYQDDGKTLKVFVEKMRNKPEWIEDEVKEAIIHGMNDVIQATRPGVSPIVDITEWMKRYKAKKQ